MSEKIQILIEKIVLKQSIPFEEFIIIVSDGKSQIKSQKKSFKNQIQQWQEILTISIENISSASLNIQLINTQTDYANFQNDIGNLCLNCQQLQDQIQKDCSPRQLKTQSQELKSTKGENVGQIYYQLGVDGILLSRKLLFKDIQGYINRSIKEIEAYDVFCKIKCGKQLHQTKTQDSGGKEPFWQEAFEFIIIDEQILEVEVFQTDGKQKVETIGSGRIRVKDIANQYLEQLVKCQLIYQRKESGQLYLKCEWQQKQQQYTQQYNELGETLQTQESKKHNNLINISTKIEQRRGSNSQQYSPTSKQSGSKKKIIIIKKTESQPNLSMDKEIETNIQNKKSMSPQLSKMIKNYQLSKNSAISLSSLRNGVFSISFGKQKRMLEPTEKRKTPSYEEMIKLPSIFDESLIKNRGTNFGYGQKKFLPDHIISNATNNPSPQMYNTLDGDSLQNSKDSNKGHTFGLSYQYYKKVFVPEAPNHINPEYLKDQPGPGSYKQMDFIGPKQLITIKSRPKPLVTLSTPAPSKYDITCSLIYSTRYKNVSFGQEEKMKSDNNINTPGPGSYVFGSKFDKYSQKQKQIRNIYKLYSQKNSLDNSINSSDFEAGLTNFNKFKQSDSQIHGKNEGNLSNFLINQVSQLSIDQSPIILPKQEQQEATPLNQNNQ